MTHRILFLDLLDPSPSRLLPWLQDLGVVCSLDGDFAIEQVPRKLSGFSPDAVVFSFDGVLAQGPAMARVGAIASQLTEFSGPVLVVVEQWLSLGVLEQFYQMGFHMILNCNPDHMTTTNQIVSVLKELLHLTDKPVTGFPGESSGPNSLEPLAEVQARNCLQELCFAFGDKGYSYLLFALTQCGLGYGHSAGITKDLYPQIARHFGVSAHCVERCIRYSIEKAFHNCPETIWNRFFPPVTFGPQRPSNGVFLAVMGNHCRDQIKES